MAIDTTTNLEQPLNPTEKEPTTSSQPQIRLFKGQVILNPTISKINFGAYLLHSSYLGAITIPANLLFLPLLNIVYSLTLDERINVTTIVQLTQLAVKLMICPWLGYLCDKYGRRIFIILGIVLQCCSLAVMPHLPGIYPYYVLIQIVYEVGMMCLSAAPLLADYVDYETKGRVAGLGSVISYAASSITTELAANMDVSTGIPSKLHEVAILGLGIGILIILGVKGGNYHKALFYDKKAEDAKQHVPEILEQEAILEEEDYQAQVKKTFGNNRSRISKISKVKVRPDHHNDMEALVENMETNQRAVGNTEGLNLNDSVHDNNNPPVVAQQVVEQVARSRQVGRSRLTLVEEFKPGFRAGIREARRNPWVLTGYISGFLSFACVILLNTALINLCTEKVGSDKGPTQAYALTNKHMIVSCITAIIFGFFMDKYNKFKILLFIVTSSIFAVMVLLLSPTVYNWMAYASMVIFGWVCSGYMTITNQLVSKYADPKYRASAIAVLSMCTNLGSAMISILGVYLSKYDIAMPFYIYLGLAVVGLAVLLVIYNKKRNIFDNL